jgi:Mlc titration factor MtfA (ptsG expression regulator)
MVLSPIGPIVRRWLQRRKPQIDSALWQACVASLPCVQHLSSADLQRLQRGAEALLATHTITGVDINISDAIAVSIAAQAALPVLNLSLDLYRDMAGIIVYPGQFIVPLQEMDEAGVVHEWREAIAGEAMHAGGAVILSWEDVATGHAKHADFNVVIHEFAHKIDMIDGDANGCPPFFPAWHQALSRPAWQHAFAAAYADFAQRVAAQRARTAAGSPFTPGVEPGPDLPFSSDLPLDPYAASDPAEFFAVASEAFFVTPQTLAAAYPAVYRQLTLYYRLQPLARTGAIDDSAPPAAR